MQKTRPREVLHSGPVNRPCACCMCSPKQGLLVPRVAHSTALWPIVKAQQARAWFMFGLEQSRRHKGKERAPDISEQLPAHFLCKQEGLMEAGEFCPGPPKLTWQVCSPLGGHTPTLNVLREFFISATFSSMAQRQLLTFSSRAYSPCWIRDSSCIASVKPAFNSEANACN